MAQARNTSLVIYYIYSKSKVGNPAHLLRPRGVKLDGSVYAMYSDNVPLNVMRRISEDGNIVHIVDLGPIESSRFAGIALHCLSEQVKQAEDRQTKSLQRLLDEVTAFENDETHTQWEIRRAQSKYQKERAGVLKRTEKLLRELREGASAYDVCSKEATGLFDSLRNRVRQLAALTNSRLTAVGMVADQARAEGMASAEAIDSDEMPVGIALDQMEDAGVDVSAARAVFANAAEAGAVPTAFRDLAHAGNGNGHAHSAPTEYTGVRYDGPARIYEVTPAGKATRRVTSRMTDAEAREVLSEMTDNDFAQTVLSKRRTAYWTAWTHILAVEHLGADSQQLLEEEEQEETPAPIAAPIAKVDPVPDHTRDAELLTPTYRSNAFKYDKDTNTLSAEASSLGRLAEEAWPLAVRITSAKTGVTARFNNRQMTTCEDGIAYVEWTQEGGKTKLVIYND